MSDDMEMSAADEVAAVKIKRPHVVVLGAGASRACCPQGDKFGRVLPLMVDFATSVGLVNLLESWGCDPSGNFEDTYSELHDAGEHEKLEHLNEIIEEYFGGLALPDHPTLYDHLVLSLRETDIIATFNWDPLLLQAYRRNCIGLSMPQLAFLHGNLSVGFCERDGVSGMAGANCSRCGQPFDRTPLLYPVRHKNYANDKAIASQWELLKHGFRNAFMITIFGYSGPKTDQEAIAAMREAWGEAKDRPLEQTAFITLQSADEVRSAWDEFIHSHHYEVQPEFYDSWIAKHPRRTGEAFWNQYIEAKFIADNPIPRGFEFAALHDWYGQFDAPERKAS